MGSSINTGNPIATPEFSNIRCHAEKLNQPLLYSGFKLKKVSSTANRLLLYESLVINKRTPSLRKTCG